MGCPRTDRRFSERSKPSLDSADWRCGRSHGSAKPAKSTDSVPELPIVPASAPAHTAARSDEHSSLDGPAGTGAAISPVVGETISDLAALRDEPDVFD